MKADGTYGRPGKGEGNKALASRMSVAEAMALPALSTVEEAGRLTGNAVSTIRKMCRNGELPARRFGGAWRISTKKLFEMMEAGFIA